MEPGFKIFRLYYFKNSVVNTYAIAGTIISGILNIIPEKRLNAGGKKINQG